MCHGIAARLQALDVPSEIITGDWDEADLSRATTLPLVNYGISGINRFEDFDAAYCLTGFYTNPKAIEDVA